MAEKSSNKKQTSQKIKKTNHKRRSVSVKKKKIKFSYKKFFWLSLFYFGLAIGLAVILYVAYCFVTLPDIEKAVSKTRQPSTTIIAENGQEIARFGNVYSEVIYPKDLPDYVKNAIIDTEDRRFYSHFGFDVIAFSRAMVTNIIQGRYAQGGSTISQQVAKNLFLTSNKNIKRKVQELLMAFWLESKFSKDQILTLYLNRVYMGNGTFGIEAASQAYFQKSSRDLNMLEGAVLAGLLKAPARYNPIANNKKARERATVVLQNMVNVSHISPTQKEKALKLPLGNQDNKKESSEKYFADWVYHEVNAYIGERETDVNVFTTLDKDLQKKTAQILRDTIRKQGKGKNVTNGAVIVLDKSGAVKAMVGGIDYKKSQFNRATQALRQPGSAFKTFVYLQALEDGWERNDTLEDYPISIGKWSPENYNKKYNGEVEFEEAFIRSLNLATVYLGEKLNRKDIILLAQKAGISTPINNNPAMVLGSSEVKVLDMAIAYSAIANGGIATWPYSITDIYDKDGYPVYTRIVDDEEPQRIFDEDAVEEITIMLENVIQKGTGQKAQLPFFAAGKTGTSQDYRDAWFAGFTDNYIAVVWIGNDNNSPMKKIGGGTLPAEIWRKVMLFAESRN